MEQKLCDEKHLQIARELNNQYKRLNDHAERIKELEQLDVGRSKDIENLCRSMNH